MVNLREVILKHRIKYYVDGSTSTLSKAQGCLERYFFLIVFTSYVNDYSCSDYPLMFSKWLTGRTEIGRVLEHMRKKGPKLYLFRPIEDLSALSPTDQVIAGWGVQNRPLANELERFVLKSRKGSVLVAHSILKIDQWFTKESHDQMEGAHNFRLFIRVYFVIHSFRKVPDLNIYAVAQPTSGGMKNVIELVKQDLPTLNRLIWINLREEPLIYCNGIPYVLRDQYLTLRNTKSYSGITPARLELIESKLKEDVQQEIQSYDSKILLHGETEQGNIVPLWEDCKPESIHTFKEVIAIVQSEQVKESQENNVVIDYYRVPITAETPPDLVDLDLLLNILTKTSIADTAIVLNCQMGQGRSTTGTVIASLILHWLYQTKPEFIEKSNRLNYQVIHSLLRVIRNGLESKRIVDDVIDSCSFTVGSQTINLRDMIEQSRLSAETALDETQKMKMIKRGLLQLKRYFMLILFQTYLDQTLPASGDRMESFSNWYLKHPEFKTIREELDGNIVSLTPVDILAPGDGVALTNEVLEVVNSRQGAVVAQGTIIKYDVFPGSQKMSLPEKIEGAPNFRKVVLTKDLSCNTSPTKSPVRMSSRRPSLAMESLVIHLQMEDFQKSSNLYGIAMPTKDAICRVLSKIGCGIEGSRHVLWTSLREEPVIYVNGRPYVLRLFPDPLRNLEATGIARERVELMELQMKKDIIEELKKYGGRVLLHEEHMNGNEFAIVPLWESVKEEDVLTPLEVYKSIQKEGYHVDYLRIPITDEQAPIPNVFDQLVERVLSAKSSSDLVFNCQQG